MSTDTAERARDERRAWRALPRRRPPRPRSAVFTLRVPISRRARWTLTALSIVVPIAAWWVLSASGLVRPASYLPSPAATFAAGLEMARSGQLYADAVATVQRVFLGSGLAVVVSVPLGIVMGSFRAGWSLFEPVIGLLRYLPPGSRSTWSCGCRATASGGGHEGP